MLFESFGHLAIGSLHQLKLVGKDHSPTIRPFDTVLEFERNSHPKSQVVEHPIKHFSNVSSRFPIEIKAAFRHDVVIFTVGKLDMRAAVVLPLRQEGVWMFARLHPPAQPVIFLCEFV